MSRDSVILLNPIGIQIAIVVENCVGILDQLKRNWRRSIEIKPLIDGNIMRGLCLLRLVNLAFPLA